jgi:3-isopropylmalate/(R)-2-methylmalate dehydratase small subunit
MLSGRAHKLGNDINTDYIISSRRRARVESITDMARFLLEDIDPGFYSRLRPGDFIVAGSNFGSGSSRETAPRVIQAAGIAAVLAESFARIFFRNSISIGLPVVLCDTRPIDDGDDLVIDLAGGMVQDHTRGITILARPIPAFMQSILEDGGLLAHLQKHGGFHLG